MLKSAPETLVNKTLTLKLTTGTRRRQLIVIPKRYDRGYLVCYGLSASKKMFKKKENIPRVVEGVL